LALGSIADRGWPAGVFYNDTAWGHFWGGVRRIVHRHSRASSPGTYRISPIQFLGNCVGRNTRRCSQNRGVAHLRLRHERPLPPAKPRRAKRKRKPPPFSAMVVLENLEPEGENWDLLVRYLTRQTSGGQPISFVMSGERIDVHFGVREHIEGLVERFLYYLCPDGNCSLGCCPDYAEFSRPFRSFSPSLSFHRL
jgi:hypothetical protein